jgi:hypothetical protein
LHQIFGFTGVSQNAQSDVQHETVIAIEKHSQGIVMAVPQVGHQGLI